jgi:hypothetical protein
MRRFLLAGILLFATSSAAAAAPCLADTLANYKALGPGGCSIGGVTFADFDSFLLSAIPGAIEISAGAVLVTPSGRGFDFAFDVAPSDDFSNILIHYTAAAAGVLRGNQLAMTGSSATGDGIVTAVEDKCVGDIFFTPFPDPAACLSGESVTLIAITDEVIKAPGFSPSSFFDVFAEITVDPGTFGTAGLQGTVSTQFIGNVPEPLMTLLVGAGLGVTQLRRRFRLSALGFQRRPVGPPKAC